MNNNYDEFQSYSRLQLNEAFVDACTNGHFEKVKYLLTSPSLPYNANIFYDDTACFKLAFHNGHVNIIKYLSSSQEIKKHIDVKPYAYNILNFARKTKDWEWLEFLLPLIVNENNQHFKNIISTSCRDGDYETIHYLFNSTKWKDKIKVDNELYNDACFGCNVKIIDFLKNNFQKNISITDDRAFLNCYASIGYYDDLKVMEYFIFNLNVPFCNDIKEYLADDQLNIELATNVKNMFETRELQNELKNKLTVNDSNKIRKNKI